MKTHPLAELFPLMNDAEIAVLAADIKANGVRAAITLLDGMILDGRNRHRACEIAGVEPKFREHKGGDPLAFVLSANLHRRHLTASQRAMVAANLENMDHGGDRKSTQHQDAILHLDRASAAESLAVSPRSVSTAAKIKKESPQLAAEVAAGKISLNAAVKKTEAARPAPTLPADSVRKDAVGQTIPPKLHALWDRAEAEAKEGLRICSQLRSALKRAQENDDVAYREMNFSSTIAHLSNAYGDMQCIKPHAVCHACRGNRPEKCVACKGRGFVSAFFWKMCVPEEFKNIISKP